MSKIITRIMKKLILFISLLLFLYLSLLTFNNQNTMIITMSSEESPLRTQLYFASQGETFQTSHSSTPYTIKGNKYYFTIPKMSEINYLRLDPSYQESNVTIKNITIVRDRWFKTRMFDIPIKHILPNQNIVNLHISSDGISFESQGKFSQLNIQYFYKEISSKKNYHSNLLFIAFLLLLVLGYLHHVYKNTSYDTTLASKLVLYGLFFTFVCFKLIYYKNHVNFGYPPDESTHLKYINYIKEHPSIIPDFTKMSHYLNHPPLYYSLLATAHDEDASKSENILHYRSLSILIYIFAFLLILYIGFSSQLSIVGHLVYLSFITSLPMHAYLGASISNDTLAMLGAIIFIVGMKRLLELRYDWITYFIISFGIFIAYFSKLTAALLIFFALIYFIIHMFKTKEWIKLKTIHIAIIVLFLMPIAYYQLNIILEYHSLMPSYHITHPKSYLTSGFYIPEEHRQNLSPYAWFQRMIHYIEGGWFGIHSHHSFTKTHWLGFAGLLILHIFAIISLFVSYEDNKKIFSTLGKMTLLGLFSVLVIQYFFSYQGHLKSGYLGGLQPRYLLPFMVGFAIMSSLFVERYKQYFWFNIAILLVCIHAIYSDFFYFLQYYN